MQVINVLHLHWLRYLYLQQVTLDHVILLLTLETSGVGLSLKQDLGQDRHQTWPCMTIPSFLPLVFSVYEMLLTCCIPCEEDDSFFQLQSRHWCCVTGSILEINTDFARRPYVSIIWCIRFLFGETYWQMASLALKLLLFSIRLRLRSQVQQTDLLCPSALNF